MDLNDPVVLTLLALAITIVGGTAYWLAVEDREVRRRRWRTFAKCVAVGIGAAAFGTLQHFHWMRHLDLAEFVLTVLGFAALFTHLSVLFVAGYHLLNWIQHPDPISKKLDRSIPQPARVKLFVICSLACTAGGIMTLRYFDLW